MLAAQTQSPPTEVRKSTSVDLCSVPNSQTHVPKERTVFGMSELVLCLPKTLSGMTRAWPYGNGSGRWSRF